MASWNYHETLSPATFTALILLYFPTYLMEPQYSSCRLTCHNCGHEWTYMGNRIASLNRSGRPVKAQCPRCGVGVVMDVKNAR